MELVLLVLAVPVLWLFLTPRRVLRRASVWPLLKPALVGGVLLAGGLVVSVMQKRPPPDGAATAIADADAGLPVERRIHQTMDYARGDDQLRAMLH